MSENLLEDTLYIVALEEAHLRLDEFVHKQEALMPIAAIRRAIEAGNVLVNNLHRSSGWRVRVNDQISVKLSSHRHLEIQAENVGLEILYEDEFLIVVNKPPGMISHPSRHERTGTLLNALLYHSLKQGEKNPRLGLVHRLDRDTSGILLVSKKEKALQRLAQQFDQRQVKKFYQAVVFGLLKDDSGEVNAPIGWATTASPHWGVRQENSKHAYTTYQVKLRINNFSWVELQPHTGRTHQLRVHMSHIGHPIVGDLLYGLESNQIWQGQNLRYKLPRQLLHASTLIFNHPINNEQITLSAPIPRDIQDFIEFNQ